MANIIEDNIVYLSQVYQSADCSITISRAKETESGNDIVVKRIINPERGELERIRSKLQKLKSLSHPNLLTPRHILNLRNHTAEGIQAVFHVIPSSLDKEFAHALSTGEPLRNLSNIVMQLLDIFAHLENKQVSHGNICPENILITEDFRVLVCGIRCMNLVTSTSVAMKDYRSYKNYLFSSPEYQKGEMRDLIKSDVFSLGLLILRLARNDYLYDLVITDQSRINQEISYVQNDFLRSLLGHTLRVNPESRKTFDHLHNVFICTIPGIEPSVSTETSIASREIVEDISPCKVFLYGKPPPKIDLIQNKKHEYSKSQKEQIDWSPINVPGSSKSRMPPDLPSLLPKYQKFLPEEKRPSQGQSPIDTKEPEILLTYQSELKFPIPGNNDDTKLQDAKPKQGISNHDTPIAMAPNAITDTASSPNTQEFKGMIPREEFKFDNETIQRLLGTSRIACASCNILYDNQVMANLSCNTHYLCPNCLVHSSNVCRICDSGSQENSVARIFTKCPFCPTAEMAIPSNRYECTNCHQFYCNICTRIDGHAGISCLDISFTNSTNSQCVKCPNKVSYKPGSIFGVCKQNHVNCIVCKNNFKEHSRCRNLFHEIT